MSTSTLPDAAYDSAPADAAPDEGSVWTQALDPRGTFVTLALAVAATVAVVVLVSSAIRLVTGG